MVDKKEMMKRLRRLRERAGLCVSCGMRKSPADFAMKNCAKCRLYHATRAKNRRNGIRERAEKAAVAERTKEAREEARAKKRLARTARIMPWDSEYGEID